MEVEWLGMRSGRGEVGGLAVVETVQGEEDGPSGPSAFSVAMLVVVPKVVTLSLGWGETGWSSSVDILGLAYSIA